MRQWDENGKQVVDEGVMCDGALCQHHYFVIWFHANALSMLMIVASSAGSIHLKQQIPMLKERGNL